MAAGNYLSCLSILLLKEGGFVVDNGGPTNLGVTQRTLSSYLGKPATLDDVKALTRVTVTPLYQAMYWDEVWGDKLYPGLDLCVFDAAVNSGPAQAIKWLQRAVGQPADGVMGPRTLDAIMKTNPYDTLREVCTLRVRMMLGLDNAVEERNEKGWSARVLEILQLGTLMLHEKAATSLPSGLQAGYTGG